MGVRGLLTYIQSKFKKELQTIEALQGKKILFDASALVNFLFKAGNVDRKKFQLPQFAKAVRDLLGSLTKNGNKLYFVFDGCTEKMRVKTKKERSQESNYSTSLYVYLFIQILHKEYKNRIQWEIAEGGASLRVVEVAKGGDFDFVFTSDSDLFLTGRNVLTYDQTQPTSNWDIYNLKDILKVLGLGDNLPLFMCLLGNDYFEPPDALLDKLQLPKQRDAESVETVLRRLKASESNTKPIDRQTVEEIIKSTSSHLLEAFEYAIKYYESFLYKPSTERRNNSVPITDLFAKYPKIKENYKDGLFPADIVDAWYLHTVFLGWVGKGAYVPTLRLRRQVYYMILGGESNSKTVTEILLGNERKLNTKIYTKYTMKDFWSNGGGSDDKKLVPFFDSVAGDKSVGAEYIKEKLKSFGETTDRFAFFARRYLANHISDIGKSFYNWKRLWYMTLQFYLLLNAICGYPFNPLEIDLTKLFEPQTLSSLQSKCKEEQHQLQQHNQKQQQEKNQKQKQQQQSQQNQKQQQPKNKQNQQQQRPKEKQQQQQNEKQKQQPKQQQQQKQNQKQQQPKNKQNQQQQQPKEKQQQQQQQQQQQKQNQQQQQPKEKQQQQQNEKQKQQPKQQQQQKQNQKQQQPNNKQNQQQQQPKEQQQQQQPKEKQQQQQQQQNEKQKQQPKQQQQQKQKQKQQQPKEQQQKQKQNQQQQQNEKQTQQQPKQQQPNQKQQAQQQPQQQQQQQPKQKQKQPPKQNQKQQQPKQQQQHETQNQQQQQPKEKQQQQQQQ
jgi:hypothetical protein